MSKQPMRRFNETFMTRTKYRLMKKMLFKEAGQEESITRDGFVAVVEISTLGSMTFDCCSKLLLLKITMKPPSNLDPAAWVLNAMWNCVHSNWGFATISGEVNVQFIAAFRSPFDRKKNPI